MGGALRVSSSRWRDFCGNCSIGPHLCPQSRLLALALRAGASKEWTFAGSRGQVSGLTFRVGAALQAAVPVRRQVAAILWVLHWTKTCSCPADLRYESVLRYP